MDISLTTHWNASRHNNGRAMIEEILELGFTGVELGYDTRRDLVEGVQAMVQQGAVRVTSLHNFCPVPMGASRGHPELYTFGSLDDRERINAVRCTIQTIELAATVGARVIVSHSGNVTMKRRSGVLKDMLRHNQKFTSKYERTRQKFMVDREKRGRKHLPNLYRSIEELLPHLEQHRVAIALENLPTWEAIPTETEIEALCNHFNSPYVKYWHDMGHGQIRENMGMINHLRWLQRLEPHLGGLHVHDVTLPVKDHTMPPLGHIEFALFKKIGGRRDIPRVIEPRPPTPAEEIVEALRYLREVWAEDTTPALPAATQQPQHPQYPQYPQQPAAPAHISGAPQGYPQGVPQAHPQAHPQAYPQPYPQTPGYPAPTYPPVQQPAASAWPQQPHQPQQPQQPQQPYPSQPQQPQQPYPTQAQPGYPQPGYPPVQPHPSAAHPAQPIHPVAPVAPAQTQPPVQPAPVQPTHTIPPLAPAPQDNSSPLLPPAPRPPHPRPTAPPPANPAE